MALIEQVAAESSRGVLVKERAAFTRYAARANPTSILMGTKGSLGGIVGNVWVLSNKAS